MEELGKPESPVEHPQAVNVTTAAINPVPVQVVQVPSVPSIATQPAPPQCMTAVPVQPGTKYVFKN